MRQLVAQGAPLHEIGTALGIAPDHIAHIMSLDAVVRRAGRLTA